MGNVYFRISKKPVNVTQNRKIANDGANWWHLEYFCLDNDVEWRKNILSSPTFWLQPSLMTLFTNNNFVPCDKPGYNLAVQFVANSYSGYILVLKCRSQNVPWIMFAGGMELPGTLEYWNQLMRGRKSYPHTISSFIVCFQLMFTYCPRL